MSDINELFQRCVDNKLDKNATIMRLATEGGLDVTAAVREYQKLARNAGMVLGTKERTEKIEAMLGENDLKDPKVRSELIVQIADDYDVSTATAAAHIRKYAIQHDIDIPTQQRNSLEDMVAFVKELLDEDKSRADVVAALQNEMGYTANSAASAYSRATRELGITTGRTGPTVPLSETVAFMRANHLLGRKELTKAMTENLGYAESTAGSFITYINFAKEWARQEQEEANTAAAA